MGSVMNALATASSKAVFGDLMTAHQTVASNTPAKLAATKFADYLEEKQSANRLPRWMVAQGDRSRLDRIRRTGRLATTLLPQGI